MYIHRFTSCGSQVKVYSILCQKSSSPTQLPPLICCESPCSRPLRQSICGFNSFPKHFTVPASHHLSRFFCPFTAVFLTVCFKKCKYSFEVGEHYSHDSVALDRWKMSGVLKNEGRVQILLQVGPGSPWTKF